ncbi:MAG: hypothetical protein PHR87_07820 [Sulfurospirillaceae bacterium]|nr:hypothetical protein [Sulfurospirillaceae bacterium]
MPLLSLTLDRPTFNLLDTITTHLELTKEEVIAQALQEFYEKYRVEKKLKSFDNGQVHELSQQEYARLKAEQ